MSGLITGAFGTAMDLAGQRRFFEDLENSSTAAFYDRLGSVGRLFLTIELQAFQMAL